MKFLKQYKNRLCDCTRYSDEDEIHVNRDIPYKTFLILFVLQLFVSLRVLAIKNFTAFDFLFPCNLEEIDKNITTIYDLKQLRDDLWFTKDKRKKWAKIGDIFFSCFYANFLNVGEI
uniref:Uncharacterized protein n=1 Tax=Panagrolaimus superbus TaxID=310955 RepID=A0A914YBD9_9BILA